MIDYIVDHAQHNVWCVPGQDMQSIVKPQRLTPLGGVLNWADIMQRRYTLPQQNVRFHVYMVGQLHPLMMGLLPKQYQWITMAAACNAQHLIVDVYAKTGVQIPRYESWYIVTPDKNLLIAVKEQPMIPVDLDSEDLFVRVYRNAYFNNNQSGSNGVDGIQVTGQRINNSQDILTMQAAYKKLALNKGAVYAFINGYRVSHIDPFTVKVGDIVEYVWDSSIYQILDFKIQDLQMFTSTLDSKYKYLLHYAGVGDGSIDYQDDIDGFLIQQNPIKPERFKGVFYIRNAAGGDAMRMVTHKDYSVPTEYIAALAQSNPNWLNVSPQSLTLRLHVRKGGWLRPLVFENNRIEELYKLPDAQIVAAMIGVDATVPNWTAATLEASAYTAIMRNPGPLFSKQLVQDAYGYNAIAKLIGDTPSKTTTSSGQQTVPVPYGLQNISQAYEYDSTGLLLGNYPVQQGDVYGTANPQTRLVELISGLGNVRLDEVYGQATSLIDPEGNYRFYTTPIGVDGNSTNIWTDVTGTGAYATSGNKVTWLIDMAKFDTLVRGDTAFLAYQVVFKPTDGLLQFQLSSRVVRNFLLFQQIMQVPMGELDLWLNGHALVEDIDYIVRFPKIYITNKTYLEDVLNQEQVIDVRFTGFCNSDLSMRERRDFGWVKYGQLSNNNRFDIRDDKVLRIQVGGNTMARSDLSFAENNPAILVPSALNGMPYEIRDIVVPLRGLAVDDTYSLRAKSAVIDDIISDYLTLKMPEVEPTTPSAIPAPWPVYSPMCTKILYDLMNGVLNDPRIIGTPSDQVVLAICKSYEYLLTFDQTQDAQLADKDYMTVQPHNLNQVVTVSIYFYRFLSRVNALYLHNRVNLSHFIRIASI